MPFHKPLSIMYSSDYNKYIKVVCGKYLDRICEISANKMHQIECSFFTTEAAYRAKNDPGD